MKSIQTISILFLILLMTGCATTLESTWHSDNKDDTVGNVPMDGFHFSRDAGIMYSVSNTTDSLFLDIKFPNELTAAKVLRLGFSTWIDPSANKNKVFGVHFPLGRDGSPGNPSGQLPKPEIVEGEDGFKRLRYPEAKQRSQKMLLKDNMEIILSGFKNYEGKQKMPKSESPFPAKLFYDQNNILSYHLAISFESIQVKQFQDGDAISIGLIAGKVKGQDHNKRMRDRDPMGGGRRGGMIPGGTMGGNRRTGSTSRYPAMAQPEIVWIKKVYLAKKGVAEKQ